MNGDSPMVRALEDAFDRVNRLPKEQQEEFAVFIMEELAAQERWSRLLGDSQDALASLAREALSEHRRGKTRPFEADGDLTHD